MGLLELKTNLKSLKYEGIEKPLITKDINNPPNTGGIAMQVNHRIDDVVRLGKLMTKKQGLKFLGNQALLAQTNIKQDIAAQKSKSAKAIAKAIGKRLKETAIDTVLGAASIIAQAPLNGTGGHIPRGFIPSTHLKSGNQGGIATLAAPDGTIIPNNGPNGPAEGGSFQVSDDYQITDLGKTTENKYNSGEQWIKQFGKFQRAQKSDYVDIQGSPSNIVKGGGTVGINNTGDSIWSPLAKSELKDKESESPTITVNRLGKPSRSFKQRPDELTKEKDIKEQTYLQQKFGKETTSITVKANDKAREKREEGLQDKADPIQSLALDTAEITSAAETDIIPFTFNVWTPGDAEGKFIYFRAFLDSFSDNFTGAWNSNKFIGRGDNLLTYGGFERGISFGFKVAAFSKADIKPLYEKLNHLVGSTAPSYSGEGTFMKGTFVSLTVGDYIVRQSGVIESIGLTWQTSYPWELTGDDDTKRVPHVLDVAVTFKPIHSFVPQVAGQFIYQDA
jgi:hypothetical protein